MLGGVPLMFPDGFLWGTATSSHQVEGGNSNNQWWDWEHQPGRIWNGDRSGDACDWWRDAERDLEHAAQLGQNAHRLSVEWSRIEPNDGEFDQNAIARYRGMLEFMRSHGIRPMVTLHHFTNPRWLEARGGWLWDETPERFARFSGQVVAALGDVCDLWCTVNEPVIYAVMGYLLGQFPPGRTDFLQAVRVVSAMLRGHARAAQAVRAANKSANVGIVHHMRLFVPASQSLLDGLVARTWDYLCNGAFLQALETGILPPPLGAWERVPGLKGSNDFVGLNYYTREHISFDPRLPQMGFGRRFTPPGLEQSDKGKDGHTYGEVYPHGLEIALDRMARLNCPVFVTEFGLPDADDKQRPHFLVNHMRVIHQAIGRGVDVRGAFHWSLTDNFEWAEGWGLRFGLIALDQHSGERRERASAQVHARMAKANAIPDDLLETFENIRVPHGVL